MKLVRTNSKNSDFIQLVDELDTYLAIVDGEEHEFYSKFSQIDKIKNVVVVYENEIPVACGAIRALDENSTEIKRMYTKSEVRGIGIATKLLKELEQWAKDLGFEKCILETGIKQPDAVYLYEKNGYKLIPNYGQYIGLDNSVCYEKEL